MLDLELESSQKITAQGIILTLQKITIGSKNSFQFRVWEWRDIISNKKEMRINLSWEWIQRRDWFLATDKQNLLFLARTTETLENEKELRNENNIPEND